MHDLNHCVMTGFVFYSFFLSLYFTIHLLMASNCSTAYRFVISMNMTVLVDCMALIETKPNSTQFKMFSFTWPGFTGITHDDDEL